MVFAVILVILSALCASPQSSPPSEQVPWEPPPTVWPTEVSKPTIPKEMVSDLRVGGANIVLEKTSLAGLQAAFGGSIGQRGDAGGFLEWLCLAGGNGNNQWVLWLESGEIDDGAVGGFQWQGVGPLAVMDRRCARVPDSRGGIDLPNALHLGLTKSGLIRILGRPTARRRSTLFFLHEHEKSIEKRPYTVSNSVSAVLKGGIVRKIEVWKSTVF